MDIIFDKINILLLVIIFLNLILGFIIFFNGRNRKINIIYSLNIVTIIGWVLGMILYRSAQPETSLFWCMILYIVPTFIASSFLYFTYIFPTKTDTKVLLKSSIIFFINITIVAMVAWPGLIIEEVNVKPGFEKEIIFTKFYWFYFLYTAGFFSYGFLRLFRKFSRSVGIERLQIIYLLLGYAIAANLAFVTNLIMPWIGFFFLNWLGQVFTITMVGFAAYAIIRHRLMDIKLVMRRYSVYLTSLSAVIILATAVKYILIIYFVDITFWADFAILILAILAFPPIKDYFYRLGNKYFFSSLYDSREVIADISDKLRTTLEAGRIYDFIYESLNHALHFKAFGILGYNEKEEYYLTQYNKGFILEGQKKFLENKELHKMFVGRNEAIIVEEMRHSFYNKKTKGVVDLLEKLKVDILVPLNIKDKTIGLMALGPKESGDMYNDEDLKVLRVVSAQAAIAIENALLYGETLNFNIKLKKEIEKATEELRKANIDLKKLDQAKSDFISIASHQLRTPLTVIKGYISMMLEGSFGELNPAERDSLEKVYASGERLIQLVENLLNISRIESGRLQFNYEEIQLDDMVASVVEELSGYAKKKGLKLGYKKPEKALPKLKIDDEKIRQVVMNLIDNSIKYTKKGSITVSLKKRENFIRFCVSDSGMGIEKGDLSNLFKKFSRGKGVSTIHTEGTGLGLYVAKEMIDAHNGKIWAESKGQGKGSKFCFELPIK